MPLGAFGVGIAVLSVCFSAGTVTCCGAVSPLKAAPELLMGPEQPAAHRSSTVIPMRSRGCIRILPFFYLLSTFISASLFSCGVVVGRPRSVREPMAVRTSRKVSAWASRSSVRARVSASAVAAVFST